MIFIHAIADYLHASFPDTLFNYHRNALHITLQNGQKYWLTLTGRRVTITNHTTDQSVSLKDTARVDIDQPDALEQIAAALRD